jgi:hypothetical protein
MIVSPSLTREDLAKLYGVSQGYLGYLLREKKVPLPVRINGETLWYADEVAPTLPRIKSLLERKKKVN